MITTSIIILSWNGWKYLYQCLNSLSSELTDEDEIVVIENASTSDIGGMIRKRFPKTRVVQNKINQGVAGGWNTGIEYARGEFLLFVNQDLYVTPGWLKEMKVSAKESRQIRGCKLLYPDGVTIQHAGGKLHTPLAITTHIGHGERDIGQYDQERVVDYVTGAAFGLSRSLLNEIGYFDTRYYPAYFEDLDICLRAIEAGYSVIYNPRAKAIHYQGTSVGVNSAFYFYTYHINRLRFVEKFYEVIDTKEFLTQELARINLGRTKNEIHGLTMAYSEFCEEADLRNNQLVQNPFSKIVQILNERMVTNGAGANRGIGFEEQQ